MPSITALLAAFLLGAASWTLLEYLLHRFVFHGVSATRPGAREHRQHHARVDYFAPWWQKGLAALAVTALLGPAAVALAGPGAGLCFTAAFIITYLGYEWLHRRAHTHAPSGAYGRWLRRNHFAHHFHDPRRAQGVTTPLWDRVFGTRLPCGRVRVPRRLAMPWLVDERGELRPAFAADYELVGSARRDADTLRADARAALENRRPEPLSALPGSPDSADPASPPDPRSSSW